MITPFFLLQKGSKYLFDLKESKRKKCFDYSYIKRKKKKELLMVGETSHQDTTSYI